MHDEAGPRPLAPSPSPLPQSLSFAMHRILYKERPGSRSSFRRRLTTLPQTNFQVEHGRNCRERRGAAGRRQGFRHLYRRYVACLSLRNHGRCFRVACLRCRLLCFLVDFLTFLPFFFRQALLVAISPDFCSPLGLQSRVSSRRRTGRSRSRTMCQKALTRANSRFASSISLAPRE